jgi:hypothetical protein
LGISDGHFNFAHVRILDGIVYGGKILLDGVFYVFDSLGLGITLGPAPWHPRASGAIAFIGLMQDYFVFHESLSFERKQHVIETNLTAKIEGFKGNLRHS